ncbi:MAG: hypothetical protein ABH871_01980 [Pseudomonadota bacterium]
MPFPIIPIVVAAGLGALIFGVSGCGSDEEKKPASQPADPAGNQPAAPVPTADPSATPASSAAPIPAASDGNEAKSSAKSAYRLMEPYEGLDPSNGITTTIPGLTQDALQNAMRMTLQLNFDDKDTKKALDDIREDDDINDWLVATNYNLDATESTWLLHNFSSLPRVAFNRIFEQDHWYTWQDGPSFSIESVTGTNGTNYDLNEEVDKTEQKALLTAVQTLGMEKWAPATTIYFGAAFALMQPAMSNKDLATYFYQVTTKLREADHTLKGTNKFGIETRGEELNEHAIKTLLDAFAFAKNNKGEEVTDETMKGWLNSLGENSGQADFANVLLASFYSHKAKLSYKTYQDTLTQKLAELATKDEYKNKDKSLYVQKRFENAVEELFASQDIQTLAKPVRDYLDKVDAIAGKTQFNDAGKLEVVKHGTVDVTKLNAPQSDFFLYVYREAAQMRRGLIAVKKPTPAPRPAQPRPVNPRPKPQPKPQPKGWGIPNPGK